MSDRVVSHNQIEMPQLPRGQELGWSVYGSQAQVSVQPISPPEVMPPQRPTRRSRRQQRAERSRQQRSAAQRMTTATPPRKAPGRVPPDAPPRSRPARKVRAATPPPRRTGSGWKFSMLFTVGISITGGLGLMSLVWLTRLPPMPECDRVSLLSPDPERLYCAQEAARSGELRDLKAAVKLVQDWTPRHPLYTESQHWLGRWSRNLMEIARQRYGQSDLKGALAIAEMVPESSPIYADAQAAIAEWQAEWEQGQSIYTTAQEALKQQNWGEASQQLLALGQLESPFWRERQMGQLTEQIFAERSSWTALQEARKQARRETPENLQAALLQLRDIHPQTHAWDAAQKERREWGRALAEMGWERWQQGDTAGAIALAQAVPTDIPLQGELDHLVHYSHAQRLAHWQIDTDLHPTPAHLWRLREAIAALQAIPASSAFHDAAQAHLADWEAQLADVTQLQMASAIASFGQRQALELAITQAGRVGLERPRRQQAQTLVAFWHDQIQRLQDQPILVRAEDIASAKTIPDLQRAIALAETIGLDRALHREAQEAIASWIDQIQTIEDQPMLDRARELAEQNQLRQAIREARKIREGRALYGEAIAAIEGWQAAIDRVLIAEDRKILDEANGLAAQGSLTRAIDTAARIGRDRPLYDEARASIQQWDAERSAFWDSQVVEEAPPAYTEPAPSSEPFYEEPVYEQPEPAYAPYSDGGEY